MDSTFGTSRPLWPNKTGFGIEDPIIRRGQRYIWSEEDQVLHIYVVLTSTYKYMELLYHVVYRFTYHLPYEWSAKV